MNEKNKLEVLNNLLIYCRKASFYRDRIPDTELSSFEELKNIPLTTKEDIRNNSPFGFICVDRKELYQYHETFGTTGTPASTWLTKEDYYDLARRVNESGIGYSPEDIVLIRFPYAISSVAHFTQLAAQVNNACVVPASSRSTISPFIRIIDLMKKLEVTVLAGLPMQAVLLAETAELMGYKPDKDFPHLRAINTAGELMTPRRRKLIENIWGVPVIDNYGMTEIGPAIVDCFHGVPHPIEDSFVFEILDQDLNNEVEIGEIGNLVVTTLTRRGTPLIRYVTGDRARKLPCSCPCGQQYSIQLRGRVQDTITVGNSSFDMYELDQMLSALSFGRFWVAGPMADGIRFYVEQQCDDDTIPRETVLSLAEKYKIKLEMKAVPKGTLYDRSDLLSVGLVGKPRYIYSEEELNQGIYLKSDRN